MEPLTHFQIPPLYTDKKKKRVNFTFVSADWPISYLYS
jgi:hypothetical protein